MGPEENGGVHSTTSEFGQELRSIPLLNSAIDLYNRVKYSNKYVALSLSYAEQNVGTVFSKVTHTETGSTLDKYLGEKLADLKYRFPILQKTPKKMAKKVKVKSKRRAEKGVNFFMKSIIGRSLIGCLDASVKLSENTLGYFGISSRPEKTKTGKETSEKHVQTDSSPRPDVSNGQQDYFASYETPDEKKSDYVQGQDVSVKNVVLFPLVMMLDCLMIAQKYMYQLSGKSLHRRRSNRLSKHRPVTPEKKAEIGARRKASPKKRVPPSTFFGKLRDVACKALGWESACSNIKQTDIRQFVTCSKHKELNDSPVNADDQKKRKHDDMVSEDSETDEDLLNMDLEDYMSEEDPDYDLSEDEDDSSDTTIASDEERLDEEEVHDIRTEVEHILKEDPKQLNRTRKEKPDQKDVTQKEKPDQKDVTRKEKPDQKDMTSKSDQKDVTRKSSESSKEETKKKSEDSPLKVRFEGDKGKAQSIIDTVKSPKQIIKDVNKGQQKQSDDAAKKPSQVKQDEAVKILLRPGAVPAQIPPPSATGNQKQEGGQPGGYKK